MYKYNIFHKLKIKNDTKVSLTFFPTFLLPQVSIWPHNKFFFFFFFFKWTWSFLPNFSAMVRKMKTVLSASLSCHHLRPSQKLVVSLCWVETASYPTKIHVLSFYIVSNFNYIIEIYHIYFMENFIIYHCVCNVFLYK